MSGTDAGPELTSYGGSPEVWGYIDHLPEPVVAAARRIARERGWSAIILAGWGDLGIFVSEGESSERD